MMDGHSVSQVAKALGISDSVLRRWQRKANGQAHPSSAAPAAATPSPTAVVAEQEEIRRLKRENDRLRQERDIVKKTIAIFSGGPK